MRGRMIALTAAVAVVVAGWSGGWFWLKGRVESEMDRALADLSAKGVTVTCPDRSVAGWPFRLEITCETPTFALPDGTQGSAARFAAIGVVDDPKLVRLAFASPVTVTAADGSRVDARFDTLAASLRHDYRSLKRLSIAGTALDVTVSGGGAPEAGLKAAEVEFHVRPVEDTPENLDVALSLTKAEPSTAGAASLPAPADLAIVAVLRQAALMAGGREGLAAWQAAGGDIGLSEAAFAIGDTRIEAQGTAGLAADGTPKADITAKAEKIDWLTGQAKAGKPVPPLLATLGSAIMLLGRKEGETRVVAVKPTTVPSPPTACRCRFRCPGCSDRLFLAELRCVGAEHGTATGDLILDEGAGIVRVAGRVRRGSDLQAFVHQDLRLVLADLDPAGFLGEGRERGGERGDKGEGADRRAKAHRSGLLVRSCDGRSRARASPVRGR